MLENLESQTEGPAPQLHSPALVVVLLRVPAVRMLATTPLPALVDNGRALRLRSATSKRVPRVVPNRVLRHAQRDLATNSSPRHAVGVPFLLGASRCEPCELRSEALCASARELPRSVHRRAPLPACRMIAGRPMLRVGQNCGMQSEIQQIAMCEAKTGSPCCARSHKRVYDECAQVPPL